MGDLATPSKQVFAEYVRKIQKREYPGPEHVYEMPAGEREKFASTANTVPYHPGAIAFLEEIGLWTDAIEQREQARAK